MEGATSSRKKLNLKDILLFIQIDRYSSIERIFIIIIMLIVFLLVLTWTSSAQSCAPFGTRIQYGEVLTNPDSPQKIAISFNTNQPCSTSYLRILNRQGLTQISCSSNQIVASEDMGGFTTYIQRCFLSDEVHFNQKFTYNVFGWEQSSQEDPVPAMNDWAEVTMVDPVNFKDEVNILLLADWGVIKTTDFFPIIGSLREQMVDKDFKLMLVAGDIAYNLDSNNGQTYIQFLNMASEFFSKIPCVFVPGNHENYSDDDKILLNSTFQLYNLSLNLATGFQFVDTYIIPFDPFNVAFKLENDSAPYDALSKQLDKASETGLFVIPFSHYPLKCSGEFNSCDVVFTMLQKYFDLMIQHGVTLYLGAHAHVYERIYPYANDTFHKIESPYRDDQGYLVSIVEGVAGSNTDMVLKMDQVQNFTAAYTVSETGFGVLTINSQDQISFNQFSTRRGYMDSMVIEKIKTRRQKIDLQVQKKLKENTEQMIYLTKHLLSQ